MFRMASAWRWRLMLHGFSPGSHATLTVMRAAITLPFGKADTEVNTVSHSRPFRRVEMPTPGIE